MGARFDPRREALTKMLVDAATAVNLNSVGEALDEREFRARMADWMYEHASEYDILIDYYGYGGS